MSIFSKKVPVVYTLILGVACSALSFILIRMYSTSSAAAVEAPAKANKGVDCNYNVARIKGYKYIKPLLDQSPECESDNLAPLKQEITNYINSQKQGGIITSASVYVKSFSSDDWTYINPADKYTPGSLLKVPVMMCVLKMAETNPSFLDKKLVYDPKVIKPMDQTYNTQTIKEGKSYTVKELLSSMIANSDNAAAMLLTTNLDYTVFNKMFVDIGLPQPDLTDAKKFISYTISAREYSVFLAALYNGSYLTISASEYATSLLAQCNFKDGLIKELPANVKIAHKFGEAAMDDGKQLHESGIIYIDNAAYIITVMTKGTDVKKQADVISNISRMVYAKMQSEAS